MSFRPLTQLGLLSAVLALAVSPGYTPAVAAQDDAKFQILFSDKADDKKPERSLAIRPNEEQKRFLYVKNKSGAPANVTVEVQAGGTTVEGGTFTKDLMNDELAAVSFAKKPAEKQPGDKAPEGKAATPPPLPEVKGPLTVRVLDKDKKVIDEVPLLVAHPKDYVSLAEAEPVVYDPVEKKLTVKVKTRDTFAGSRCRVDLVLRPERITGLVDSTNKLGTRGGYLQRGGELTLTAEKLEFNGRASGLFYLNIDGYERAYIFNTDFPDAGSKIFPAPYTKPVFGLNAAEFAMPVKDFPVGLEIDNVGDARGELVIARDARGVSIEAVFDDFKMNPKVAVFENDRKVRLLLSTTDPSGCLTIKPEALDWSDKLDFSAVQGVRYLLLRKVPEKPDEQILDSAKRESVGAIVRPFILDGSPPRILKFADYFPKALARGAALPVKAEAKDDESQIKQVVFFLGKPGPDGKPPATAVPVPGKQDEKDEKLWTASLDAPTDQKGKVEVTVLATNKANLTASETIKIELIDSSKDGGKTGSIEGSIVEGCRKQIGVPVKLLDDKGAVKGAAATDDKGKFVFKDVPPGTYKLTAAKSSDNTKGEATVQVDAGQKKSDVEIKLMR